MLFYSEEYMTVFQVSNTNNLDIKRYLCFFERSKGQVVINNYLEIIMITWM